MLRKCSRCFHRLVKHREFEKKMNNKKKTKFLIYFIPPACHFVIILSVIDASTTLVLQLTTHSHCCQILYAMHSLVSYSGYYTFSLLHARLPLYFTRLHLESPGMGLSNDCPRCFVVSFSCFWPVRRPLKSSRSRSFFSFAHHYMTLA